MRATQRGLFLLSIYHKYYMLLTDTSYTTVPMRNVLRNMLGQSSATLLAFPMIFGSPEYIIKRQNFWMHW